MVYETTESSKNTQKKQGLEDRVNEVDQVSAGGVIYRICNSNHIEVALIRDQNTHNWILPKGRIEEGETLQQTSLREVQEETGLHNISLIKKIGETNYWFRTKKKNKFTKKVHFFLFREHKISEKLCVEEHNFDKGQWFSQKDAIKKIYFPAQKEILKKAFKIIKKKHNL